MTNPEQKERGALFAVGNHVFICYAREDVEFVLQLATNLKARGVPIWLDQWDIPWGANWPRSIDKAVDECAQFLVALSPAAVESDHVQGEWLRALDKKKPIYPVVCQNCDTPTQLRSRQHIDFVFRSPGDEAALAQLVQVLGGEKPQPINETAQPAKSASQETPKATDGKIAPKVASSVPAAQQPSKK